MRKFQHLGWPLRGIPGKRTRYSIRLLRYWFALSLLERMHRRLKRPLRILEVGVGGDAELRTFIGPQSWIQRWDGLDVNRPAGGTSLYDEFLVADVERPFTLPRRYDAVLLSHVLEHLAEPEAAMARLAEALEPDGLLIGGSPTMPSTIARFRERFLRRKNQTVAVIEHRHLSVITPARLHHFARAQGLDAELITGTFFLRWSGFFLENSASWIRLNLLWGALFPSLGGEVYFSLHRPTRPTGRG